MTALRSRPATPQGTVVAVVAASATLLTAAALRYGLAVLALPVAAVGALLLVRRPAVAVGLVVAVVVLGERTGTGLFPFTSALYDTVAGSVSPVEALLALALLAVVVDRLSTGRPLSLGGPLALPLALVVLAALAGAATGRAGGSSPSEIVYAGRQLAYLVVVTVLVLNVVQTSQDVQRALAFGAALAVVKAVLGLAAVVAGVGIEVEGAIITYYEPVANWLSLLVIVGVVAALLLRARPPLWLLAGSSLAALSLALSQRRSFWIGAALALLLVALLGSRPLHRRLLVPAALMLAIATWALSSVGFQAFQAQGPLVERARSLQPSKIEVNAEDRYRIDERANVVAEIGRHPLSGLGLGVNWAATHPLPVEHPGGRNYTHVVALWWWLKLGILGLAAYLSFVLTCLYLSAYVWRRSTEPRLAAAGLTFLCGLTALVLVETVGSFTGVDSRFTVIIAAVAGLLAAMYRLARVSRPA
jgi:O-antigen ligase